MVRRPRRSPRSPLPPRPARRPRSSSPTTSRSTASSSWPNSLRQDSPSLRSRPACAPSAWRSAISPAPRSGSPTAAATPASCSATPTARSATRPRPPNSSATSSNAASSAPDPRPPGAPGQRTGPHRVVPLAPGIDAAPRDPTRDPPPAPPRPQPQPPNPPPLPARIHPVTSPPPKATEGKNHVLANNSAPRPLRGSPDLPARRYARHRRMARATRPDRDRGLGLAHQLPRLGRPGSAPGGSCSAATSTPPGSAA